jgi:hypothetical protein
MHHRLSALEGATRSALIGAVIDHGSATYACEREVAAFLAIFSNAGYTEVPARDAIDRRLLDTAEQALMEVSCAHQAAIGRHGHEWGYSGELSPEAEADARAAVDAKFLEVTAPGWVGTWKFRNVVATDRGGA